MTEVFAVVNQKGGVGKTTTAVNLSAALASLGNRVLLVDCDPQGNATSGIGIDKANLERDMYDVFVDGTPFTEIIHRGVREPTLDVAPATLHLAGAEVELYQRLDRESVLKKALRPVLKDYDYVFIDGPPSLGLLTLNILTAASRVLIPIQCEYYALEGISQLTEIVQRVQSGLNLKLIVGPVVLTMHDDRINLSRQVVQEVQDYFGNVAAKTIVPRNVRLSEAPSHGLPITQYDMKSRGAQAYVELAQEIIALGK